VSVMKSVAILMNLSRPYDRQIIRGITRYLQTGPAWQLYVEENPADMIPSLSAWRGDGLIADLDDAKTVETIARFRGAVVGIGHLPASDRLRRKISTVQTDDSLIADWAAEHLLSKQLKNFAYCGMQTHGLDRWNEVRCRAFCRYLGQRGFDCSPFTGRRHAPRNWNRMQAELMRWLRRLPKPVGIMACNDVRGRHILEACRRLRLRVPEDVAVIGVDNDELMCELARPPLSSIAQNAEAIGYRAAELLQKRLQGTTPGPDHVIVPPAYLATRQSTDRVGVNDPALSAAIGFIQTRATETIGVPEVVAQTSVSRSTLEGRFKKIFGHSIRDEIERVRIDQARRLISAGSLPLDAIARRCGFRTAAYMNAVFRRALGISPGLLRNR